MIYKMADGERNKMVAFGAKIVLLFTQMVLHLLFYFLNVCDRKMKFNLKSERDNDKIDVNKRNAIVLKRRTVEKRLEFRNVFSDLKGYKKVYENRSAT